MLSLLVPWRVLCTLQQSHAPASAPCAAAVSALSTGHTLTVQASAVLASVLLHSYSGDPSSQLNCCHAALFSSWPPVTFGRCLVFLGLLAQIWDVCYANTGHLRLPASDM